MSSNAAARATYWRTYRAALVLFDAVALVLAGLFALAVRFPGDWLAAEAGTQVPYLTIIIAAVPLWLLIIAARRGYDPRILGLGSEEFRRVGNASLVFISLGALTAVAVDADPARRWVAIALPLAPLLAVTFRFAARKRLHAHRLAGAATHRVVVVGEGASQAALVDRLERSPWAGLRMVGTTRPQVDDDGRASLGHVPALVGQLGADTIAVAHSPHVTPTAMRELAWLLEGTGVGLLVAPALTDIAGPRIQVRPVSGLALLQIAEPEFGGARRLAKAAFDRLGALVLICLFSPLLVATAVAVRVTSAGPVVFRQQRIGLDGRPFTLFKFRSMYADAEQRLAELRHLSDHGDDHVLFKMADDPRITRVGAILRRFSVDELPQLMNVLLGNMSLVGPRPQLPAEVAQYESHTHRRLLVKPGITGLWQVSGRADLDWQETVRLDLYYVENWSPVLDLEILWKTLFAVINASGAR